MSETKTQRNYVTTNYLKEPKYWHVHVRCSCGKLFKATTVREKIPWYKYHCSCGNELTPRVHNKVAIRDSGKRKTERPVVFHSYHLKDKILIIMVSGNYTREEKFIIQKEKVPELLKQEDLTVTFKDHYAKEVSFRLPHEEMRSLIEEAYI